MIKQKLKLQQDQQTIESESKVDSHWSFKKWQTLSASRFAGQEIKATAERQECCLLSDEVLAKHYVSRRHKQQIFSDYLEESNPL